MYELFYLDGYVSGFFVFLVGFLILIGVFGWIFWFVYYFVGGRVWFVNVWFYLIF